MPILINDVEVEVESAGVPPPGAAPGAGPGALLTPLAPEAAELASLLDLIDERRARLMVD
jgi:hypothetical protein